MNFDDFEFDDIQDDPSLLVQINTQDDYESKELKFLKKFLVGNTHTIDRYMQFREFLLKDFLNVVFQQNFYDFSSLNKSLNALIDFYEFSQKNILLDLPNNSYNEIFHCISMSTLELFFGELLEDNKSKKTLVELAYKIPIYISHSLEVGMFITNELGGKVEIHNQELFDVAEFLSYSEVFNKNFHNFFSITILTNNFNFKGKSVKMVYSKNSEVSDLKAYNDILNCNYNKYDVENIIDELRNQSAKLQQEKYEVYRKQISALNKAILDEDNFSEEELIRLEDDLKECKNISKSMTANEEKITLMFNHLCYMLSIRNNINI